jgi:hypothetical protein
MIQLNDESLQEFAATIKQLAHWALVRLRVEFIQKEATHAFIDRVRDCELKQRLLMDSDRSLSEALNQALKLEAVKAAARPLVRLRRVSKSPMGMRLSPVEHCRYGRLVC